MEAWTTFWGAFLIVALSIFAVISIVVSIGGFADVRKLFLDLEKEEEPPPATSAPSSTSDPEHRE